MNILGMGTFEVLVILLVAFIFLGPQKMVDAARTLGKASRELRKMGESLPELVLDEEQERPESRPGSSRGGAKKPSTPAESAPNSGAHDAYGHALDEDGQVGFKPSGASGAQDQSETHGHRQRQDGVDS